MLWLTYLERFKSRLVEYLKYMFLSTRISKKIQTILLKFFYWAFHVAGLLIRAHFKLVGHNKRHFPFWDGHLH